MRGWEEEETRGRTANADLSGEGESASYVSLWGCSILSTFPPS